MIQWLEEESGEGRFESAFFRNDENEGELIVYADSSNPDYRECSERRVEAFNALPEAAVREICGQLAACAEEGGLDEADGLSDPQDILQYCWFAALYVDMAGAEDEVGYVVEGEGDWGAGGLCCEGRPGHLCGPRLSGGHGEPLLTVLLP